MSKLRGLSLFANVGIAEAHFEDIGVDILLANEIDEKRAKFYEEIYPNTEMICGDITKKDVQETLIRKSHEYGIDFVIATPPCQGMSEAGKRDEFDDRNQLIVDTINLIKIINPKFILLENVPTLLKTKIMVKGQVIKIPDFIIRELSPLYSFNEESVVRAMDHGVPQMRKRSIFLLARKDMQLKWEFPEKQEIITLKDAIGHLPSLDPILREGMDLTLKKFPDFEKKRKNALKISKWHSPPTHAWRHVEWMMHTPSATSAIYNDKMFPQKPCGTRIKAHHNNYRRMDWEKPSRTMTQNNGVISSLCCVHPGRPFSKGRKTLFSDPRVLTLYELMIVTTLPVDWNIPSWANESFIRKVIGEGIPSLLVKNIMKELTDKL